MYYNQNPYMNPYGYQNPYNQANPYSPVSSYSQANPYGQNPYMPPQQIVQPSAATIPGQMVDSFEAAKAKDIDMSGNPRYYPNLNGNEIYVKQLQADGTCQTVTYRRVTDQLNQPNQPNQLTQQSEPVQPINMDPVVAAINDMRQQIVQEVIEAVKQTIGS